jgi:type VI secretion system secreted protein VgrG
MALLGQDTLVTGPLPDGAFLLETFQGREALGKPYRYDLTLLCEDYNLPVGKVLGQSLTVRFKLDSGEFRYFNGIVTSFSKVGSAVRHARYAVVLNPTLSLLDCAHSCRVFNDTTNFDPDPEAKQPAQNAIDIVKTILGDLDVSSLEVIRTDHVYRDRRYCVQYRETDFNFVQRLLEDEGIYYFFLHEDGHHTMVMADHIGAHTKVEGYESILYLPREHKEILEEEHFWSLTVAGSLFPGKFAVLRGYDYTKVRPSGPQVESKKSARPQSGQKSGSNSADGDEPTGLLAAKYEDYDYPGGLSDQPPAEEEAQVRMQTDLVANTLIEVEGNTMGLGVGDLVTLRKAASGKDVNPFWTEADFKQEYLITAATYSISIDQYETGEAAGGDEPFRVKYTLLDTSTQFRPQRSAVKPRIEGPQTAIVVGASGDEIYTDKLARVKVQFDWDREHERDQKSSCWVRVAQVWAGKHWGAIHIPRVGQEVIVEFLDGDPDRPIITGRVYNTDCTPPYTLPDNKTQSGIKSRSSKDGQEQNFNEIRFEDLKGKEELHVQAERNMSTHVKRNQTLYVGGDQSITIHGNQTITVEGSDEKTGKKLPVQSVTKVTGKHTFDASDTIKIQAPTSITLECGGSTIVMEPGKITMTAGDGAKIVLDAEALTEAKGGGKTLHNADVLHQSKLGAQVKLDANVLAKSVPGSSLTLDANAALAATASVSIQGPAGVSVSGGTGSIGVDAAGVAVAGPKVDLSGQTMVNIAGATVKIN